jgi:DNA replication and repair protein RecF
VTLSALQAEIDARGERPFPQADLGLTGEFEKLAMSGAGLAEIEARLAADLAASRTPRRGRRTGADRPAPHRSGDRPPRARPAGKPNVRPASRKR